MSAEATDARLNLRPAADPRDVTEEAAGDDDAIRDKQARLEALQSEAGRIGFRDELQAMAIHEKCEKRCRELGDRKGLQRALEAQAFLLSDICGLEATAEEVESERTRLRQELG